MSSEPNQLTDALAEVFRAIANRDRGALAACAVMSLPSENDWERAEAARVLAVMDPEKAEELLPAAIQREPNRMVRGIMEGALHGARFL